MHETQLMSGGHSNPFNPKEWLASTFSLQYHPWLKPQSFNSHKWPRLNFSLWYQYNIKQTSDENKEKYKLREYKLIQYQILQTNITRTVWQTVRRITNEILGVKGLRSSERRKWSPTKEGPWLLHKFSFSTP